MEDFARLWIQIGANQDAIASGSMQVGLKWKTVSSGTPAINVYNSEDQNGSDDYLKDMDAAAAQIAGDFGNAVKDKNGKQTVDSTGTFIFKTDFWKGFSSASPRKYLLFEGAGEGKGELELVFLDKNGNQTGEGGRLFLDMKQIRKMYSRGHSKANNGWIPPYSFPYQPPSVTWESADNITPDFPKDEASQLIVFVHGIHSPAMSDDLAKQVFTTDADTVFKRLWWRGYKGRFAFYKWDALNALFPAAFNESEYRAWKAGKGLAEFVKSLPGKTKNIMAHSQGNAVTSSALRDYGLTVDNYLAMQGAIPALCYDASVSKDNSYHTLDKVEDLGYTGYLPSTLKTKVINFSNVNDSITGVVWDTNQWLCKPDGPGINYRVLPGRGPFWTW